MVMKEVGDIFLDIHGQHEHQSLSNKRKHLELLDEYAKERVMPYKESMKQKYQAFMAKQREWDEADLDDAKREREMLFLAHEIQEITEARLQEGEDERLEQEYRRLSNSKKIMESLGEAYRQTSSSQGASEQIGRAIREMNQVSIYDDTLQPMLDSLNDIDSLLSDFNRDLSQYMTEAEFDEQVFLEVSDRLNVINRLKDKYGATIPEIMQTCTQKQERLEKLQSFEQYLAGLKQELETSRQAAYEQAAQLSAVRKTCGEELVRQVEMALTDLNFLDVAFTMEFRELDHVTAEGFDDAEFMIRTNPGEPLRPLKDIASGGELSRIMLAIKTVLAEHDDIDTLIFDEIDAGISGRTAQAVSEKLSVVAKTHQVICITHLPQIAAMADQHYLIEKEVRGEETISTIQALSYHDSVKELARMLGGAQITQAVYDNAKEMKDLAMQQKNV